MTNIYPQNGDYNFERLPIEELTALEQHAEILLGSGEKNTRRELRYECMNGEIALEHITVFEDNDIQELISFSLHDGVNVDEPYVMMQFVRGAVEPCYTTAHGERTMAENGLFGELLVEGILHEQSYFLSSAEELILKGIRDYCQALQMVQAESHDNGDSSHTSGLPLSEVIAELLTKQSDIVEYHQLVSGIIDVGAVKIHGYAVDLQDDELCIDDLPRLTLELRTRALETSEEMMTLYAIFLHGGRKVIRATNLATTIEELLEEAGKVLDCEQIPAKRIIELLSSALIDFALQESNLLD